MKKMIIPTFNFDGAPVRDAYVVVELSPDTIAHIKKLGWIARETKVHVIKDLFNDLAVVEEDFEAVTDEQGLLPLVRSEAVTKVETVDVDGECFSFSGGFEDFEAGFRTILLPLSLLDDLEEYDGREKGW